MEMRLPAEKLQRLKDTTEEWLGKKSATKRQSLVGQLQSAAKVVKIFVSRMYSVAAKVKKMDYFTRLNKGFQSDLRLWHTFISSWNGRKLLHQSDASGSWGCGAFLGGQWLQWKWVDSWQEATIMAKELVPIVLSCAVWGPLLRNKSVLFQCDNTGVVAAVTKGSANEDDVMLLLRALWFLIAYFNIDIQIEHIAGSSNLTADHLSRNNMETEENSSCLFVFLKLMFVLI